MSVRLVLQRWWRGLMRADAREAARRARNGAAVRLARARAQQRQVDHLATYIDNMIGRGR